jgi:hypothetical protein
MKTFPIAVLAWVGLALAFHADAQRMPGRDRGGGARDGSRSEREAAKTAVPAGSQEPFAALEREMPSLKVDLRLAAEQVQPWSAFERDVKEVAELERVRRKHLLDLPHSADGITMISSLLEDERMRLDAMGDLKRNAQALYATLDSRQREMLDRRILQSQAEPLGR